MKMLRLSDAAHSKIKSLAAIAGMGMTDYMDSIYLAQKATITPEVKGAISYNPVSTAPIENGRTLKDVLAEIDDYKKDLAEEIEFCQDLGERRKLEKVGREYLDVLWKEYHSLKAQQNGTV